VPPLEKSAAGYTPCSALRLSWEAMSPDEFRELLESKGASAPCPMCGAEDWRGLDDVIDLPVRVAGATPEEVRVRLPGFEAIAPSCGRCGHVRLIDLRLLEAPTQQASRGDEDRESSPAVEAPDIDQADGTRSSGQALTNIWGQPISRRPGRKR
jgi:hypothetical protein